MSRVLRAVRTLFTDAPHSEDVHFHQGPQGTPAVCYDAGCSSPRLHVG